MHEDAGIIVRVACHMLARHGDDAVTCARARAEELQSEPRAAARWQMVENTIGVLFDDGFAPQN